MSGLRSNSRGQNDRSSLDALNRTIEGLEARLEDLLGGQAERTRREQPTERLAERPPLASRTPRQPEHRRFDPVDEIRRRQQALDDRWSGRNLKRLAPPAAWCNLSSAATTSRTIAPLPPFPLSGPSAPQMETSRVERSRSTRAPASAPSYASPPHDGQGDAALREVAEALVNLRQELKSEISQGVFPRNAGFAHRVAQHPFFCGKPDFAEDIRDDVARLAAISIVLATAPTGCASSAVRV